MTISLVESGPQGHLPRTMFEKTTLLTQLNAGTLELFACIAENHSSPAKRRSAVFISVWREPVGTSGRAFYQTSPTR